MLICLLFRRGHSSLFWKRIWLEITLASSKHCTRTICIHDGTNFSKEKCNYWAPITGPLCHVKRHKLHRLARAHSFQFELYDFYHLTSLFPSAVALLYSYSILLLSELMFASFPVEVILVPSIGHTLKHIMHPLL